MEHNISTSGSTAVLTAPAMRLRQVGVSFAGRTAVRNVSFNVDENKVTSLIGPSGSGKTTLLRSDRKSTRLNSSHSQQSRMPSSA